MIANTARMTPTEETPPRRRRGGRVHGPFGERAGDDGRPPDVDLVDGWPHYAWGGERPVDSGGPCAGVGPPAYRPSDRQLLGDVWDRLVLEERGAVGRVHVGVDDGTVTLTGVVKGGDVEERVVAAVRRVRGVNDVRSLLRWAPARAPTTAA